MRSVNYYCNDEIDRNTCLLFYDEEKNTYKVGKHNIPSLNEIVIAITGEYPKDELKKRKLLQSLHSFLLTGKKDISIETYDVVSPYAIYLKENIDDEGYYKSFTPKETINMFRYKKEITPNEINPLFEAIIESLQKELCLHVENPHHLEELASLENSLFLSKQYENISLEKKLEIKKEKIEKNNNIAWYASIEMLERPYYHLAKKQSPTENLYYASIIDIATKDSLYYVITNFDTSLKYVCFYLNIQNIELKKEKLQALYLLKNGECFLIELPKLNENVLVDAINVYKNKKDFNIAAYACLDFTNLKEKKRKKNYFNFNDYLNNIIGDLEVYNLGFNLFELVYPDVIVYKNSSLKEVKEIFIKTLITVLKNIRYIADNLSVEYALLYFYSIKKDIQEIKDIDYFNFIIEQELKIGLPINYVSEKLKENASNLGNALKQEDEYFINEGLHEVKYQRITLDLRVTPSQKEALLHYLNVNLLHYKKYLTTDDEIELNQILSIKENKKITTLNGATVNLTELYKKEVGYEGCIKSDVYLNCEIVDVRVFISEARTFFTNEKKGIRHDIPLKSISLLVDVLDALNNCQFVLDFQIIDTSKLINNNISKETNECIKEIEKENNEALTLFFDTFSIKRGEFNLSSWIGRSGIIAYKTDDKDENGKPVFLTAKGKGVFFISEFLL
ncbi:MAG: hypothetical protein ACTTJ3_07805 [Treponema sp.]